MEQRQIPVCRRLVRGAQKGIGLRPTSKLEEKVIYTCGKETPSPAILRASELVAGLLPLIDYSLSSTLAAKNSSSQLAVDEKHTRYPYPR